MNSSNKSFWTATLLVVLALTATEYAPMFVGKIPFPAGYIFDFPPFAKAAPAEKLEPHSNIGDLVMSFYPYRTLARRAVREGSIPLWNPYMLAGAPFLANTQSAVFYPLNVFYYVLPMPVAWSIGFVLRRVVAALFTVLFVRAIGGSPAGALASGLLFSFCGFLTAWQGQAMADAAIWLPLICYSVVRLRTEPSARSVALAGFAFAMPVLAGHPETAAHLTLMGVALAVCVTVGPSGASKFITNFAASGVLAIGLASVQIIPTLEWFKNIHHAFASWPPLPIWSMLGLVSRDVVRSSNSIGLLMPEHAAYIGMLSFVAAPVALLHSSRRYVLFSALSTAAALSAVYGIGPAFWVVQQLPILNALKNERLILVATFSVAVLAGLGCSVLETLNAREMPHRSLRAAIFAAAGFAVGFMLNYVVHLLAYAVVQPVRQPRFALFLLSACAAIVALKLTGILRGLLFQVLVVGIVGLDLVTLNYGAISFVRPRDVFPPIELFDRIPRDPNSPFRIAQIGYAYGANFEAMYGLSAVCGYELSLKRIKSFLTGVSGDKMDSVMLTADGVLETKDRRIDMLNAKYYIVSEWNRRYVEFRKQPDRFRFMFSFEATAVYENLRALPAAFLVPASAIEVIASDEEQLNRVKDPSFDPERRVVLSADPAAVVRSASAAAPFKLKLEWVSRSTNGFELDVNPAEKSVLVISQIAYPGWYASVDGEPAAVMRADYALQAIVVGAGAHRVRFSFNPLSFRIGLLLTTIAAIVIAVCVVKSGIGIPRRECRQ